MKKNILKQIVAALVGTGLFIILTKAQIPVLFLNDTSLQVRAVLLAFLSAVYGPVVGGIVGFAGHAIGDAVFFQGVWWGWVIADGLFGVIVGLFIKKYQIAEGQFGTKQVVLFNMVQIVANALSWIVVAPLIDLVMFTEVPEVEFAQGATAFLCNVVIIVTLGTISIIMYAKYRENKYV